MPAQRMCVWPVGHFRAPVPAASLFSSGFGADRRDAQPARVEPERAHAGRADRPLKFLQKVHYDHANLADHAEPEAERARTDRADQRADGLDCAEFCDRDGPESTEPPRHVGATAHYKLADADTSHGNSYAD